ncbi:hypothetical protein BDP27DRAFT_1361291 [Rhodocollybia butyracea]|uniref:F-box domain-containing protein n=1 Tax=Rhodocollybia butyracea TaxID=206335 RepID=A0A9P5PTH5_9AGAR|nr:hypothetical protein BDP27DRAFT_1361291 [Rhodocollybia butyracea]
MWTVYPSNQRRYSEIAIERLSTSLQLFPIVVGNVGIDLELMVSMLAAQFTTPRTNIDTVGLLQRFRSECGPDAVDTKKVAEMLKDVDKDLEDYESEILHLRSRIFYIKTQQTRLKKHAADLHSLNSPIRKIPNEILLRIFNYACCRNLLQEFPWSQDFKCAPSTSIVDPFEHLPAMISLELSPENARLPNVQSVLSDFLRIVELHLQRSGQNPLTIELDISGPVDDEDDVIPSQLLAFDLVCNHSWRSFEITGHYSISDIPKPQFDSIRNCHALENLYFAVTSNLDKEMELFQPANGLRSLSVARLSNSMPGTFWKEISALAVDSLDGGIGDVFNHAYSPRELVLGERRDQDSLPISPCVPPRSCTSVLVLQLELHLSWDDSLADVAFSSFTFPSLSTLVIMTYSTDPYQGAWPKATLGAFLCRSSCNLTKFVVKNVSVSDIDLIAALKLMPSLVNLQVDDTPTGDYGETPACDDDYTPVGDDGGMPAGDDPTSPITPPFIRSLHGFDWVDLNPSGSALVPKLRELQLTFDGLEFDDSAFIDMISSRWLPDIQYASGIGLDCLRVVTLRFNSRAVDHAVYKPVQYLDKAGMMVVVLGTDD